jgi:V/A-type H+-transporting ATPase subunit E
MDGIEKITARINADMDQEIAQIKASAQKQSDEVLADAKAQSQRLQEEIVTRGQKAADERLERLQSAAQMETRKLNLAAKQEVLDEAFDLALKKLCSLPDDEYVALLTALAVKASSSGKEKLIFSQKDRSRIGKQVVVAANEALAKHRAPELPSAVSESKVGALLSKVFGSAAANATGTGTLTLSEETRSLKGGFIMVDGDIEINCAFETLVRLQRESIEKDVAKVLFE